MPGVRISNTNPTSISARLVVPRTQRSTKLLHRLFTKLHLTGNRRALRIGLVVSNVVVLAVVLAFVLQASHTTSADKPLAAADTNAISETVSNPLDQLSSADIAQTVAQLNNLPETTAVANQAQSEAANLAMASTANNVISKPQVVATALKSRADIQHYTTVAGDTITGLAAKFGVTSDSIRWSNNLSSADTITPGTQLVIPPVNGIIYTVKPGDTPASLATQFNASADQIIAYNDAEISGLIPGQQIIIPNATQNNGATAASIAAAGGFGGGGFLFGNGPVYGYNGYDYGYCTWYVATQLPVPANWGNANTWAYYAALSGWRVSGVPTVGAIAQTSAGSEGHVAIVTAVNPDGSIQIRDMNGLAGWGRVGYGTVPASKFQHYITH